MLHCFFFLLGTCVGRVETQQNEVLPRGIFGVFLSKAEWLLSLQVITIGGAGGGSLSQSGDNAASQARLS